MTHTIKRLFVAKRLKSTFINSYNLQKQYMDVVVVGSGLVGSLCAVALGKRGYQVKLMEKRPPFDKVKQESRSINLALSTRGLTALEPYLNVDQKIPMFGRCIHPQMQVQPYSPFNKAIYSVDRKGLNDLLLKELVTMPNVQVLFNHTLKKCDFETGLATFEHDGSLVEYKSDFIVGCDGAYSSLRSLMMRRTVMNFSQYYIDHLYAEINVLPKHSEFAWDPNCLHIWPKHEYMLIALPNQDKSFTATLFMDKSRFDQLNTKEDVISFFNSNFKDFIDTVGPKQVCDELLNNPRSSLLSVKCDPFNFKKGVIIGDAAHAMVPFYGNNYSYRSRIELWI